MADPWAASRRSELEVPISNAIETLLEEYKTLRQEIANSITAQYAIVSFGAVAVGLLVTAGARAGAQPGRPPGVDEALLAAIFLLGVPAICLLVVVMWMNEVARMLRAGYHVLRLEERINLLAGRVLLTWESAAHQESQPDVERVHYKLLTRVFGLIALVFIALGLYRVWSAAFPVSFQVRLGLRVGATLLVAIFVSYAVYVLRRRRAQYVLLRQRWERRSSSRWKPTKGGLVIPVNPLRDGTGSERSRKRLFRREG